jgi:hypothetical protein
MDSSKRNIEYILASRKLSQKSNQATTNQNF